jgi:hypothetical protein
MIHSHPGLIPMRVLVIGSYIDFVKGPIDLIRKHDMLLSKMNHTSVNATAEMYSKLTYQNLNVSKLTKRKLKR